MEALTISQYTVYIRLYYMEITILYAVFTFKTTVIHDTILKPLLSYSKSLLFSFGSSRNLTSMGRIRFNSHEHPVFIILTILTIYNLQFDTFIFLLKTIDAFKE